MRLGTAIVILPGVLVVPFRSPDTPSPKPMMLALVPPAKIRVPVPVPDMSTPLPTPLPRMVKPPRFSRRPAFRTKPVPGQVSDGPLETTGSPLPKPVSESTVSPQLQRGAAGPQLQPAVARSTRTTVKRTTRLPTVKVLRIFVRNVMPPLPVAPVHLTIWDERHIARPCHTALSTRARLGILANLQPAEAR